MQSGILGLCFRLKSLLAREDGQDLVEYGLIAGLIAVLAVVVARPLAAPINSLISTVASTLTSA
jgi:pilus assembly protein Flp/PilA